MNDRERILWGMVLIRAVVAWNRFCSVQAMNKRRAHILVVDDDHNDQFLIQAAFKQVGVTEPVHAVDDGDDAICYLKGMGPYADRKKYVFPTFLLVDLKMPKVNGFELLQFLKQNPHLAVIPTIVFTSSADRNDVTNAYLLGANSYQVKSQTLPALCAQLKLIYDYWMTCEVPDIDRQGNLVVTEGSGKLSEKVPKPSTA